MYCASCGKEIFDKGKCCSSCGSSVSLKKEVGVPEKRDVRKKAGRDDLLALLWFGLMIVSYFIANGFEGSVRETGQTVEATFNILALVFLILGIMSAIADHKERKKKDK
jgi:hypothetical protein